MKYENITRGVFLKRPNRFIAEVEIGGKRETVHIKNTGRCRELLIPGSEVWLTAPGTPGRKTKYDLVAVRKETGVLFNIDSQAPNAAAKEWLQSGASPFGKLDVIKPECKFGTSRFDFYLEKEKRKIFLEVKGVTLEGNGIVLFPDAPTERGVKHVRELIRCHQEGFGPWILFVVQMENVLYFTPNRKTHPQFADALCEAQKAGVHLLAYTCRVTPDEMKINKELEIKLC